MAEINAAAPVKESPWRLGGLSAKELGKRVWREQDRDDIFGRAAELAYYFFLAIFPALIFATSVLGILAGPGTQLRNSLLQYLAQAMPGSAFQLIQQTLTEITKASGGGKLTFGLLATLWTASSGMVAIMSTLNAVYNIPEGRPIWKSRSIALGLTVAAGALVLVAIAIIIYGGALAELIASHIGLGSAGTVAWKVAQWPVALFFLSLVFALIYYYAPDLKEQNWAWITPGAIIGMVLWLVASFALRIYLHFFNSYSATYGSLGAAIILMLWFYVTGAAILIGGEINSEIENAAAKRGEPTAKEKGEKAPDEKAGGPLPAGVKRPAA